MKKHTLRREQELCAPLAEVFAFFQQPENLAKITPPWLRFTILTPPPIRMEVGAEIDYSIRWLGVRVGWTTLISKFDPPQMFVDEQKKGPYRMWRHTHLFSRTSVGTMMVDEVIYELPFGILGDVAHLLIIRQQLNAIFDYRANAIGEIFG